MDGMGGGLGRRPTNLIGHLGEEDRGNGDKTAEEQWMGGWEGTMKVGGGGGGRAHRPPKQQQWWWMATIDDGNKMCWRGGGSPSG